LGYCCLYRKLSGSGRFNKTNIQAMQLVAELGSSPSPPASYAVPLRGSVMEVRCDSVVKLSRFGSRVRRLNVNKHRDKAKSWTTRAQLPRHSTIKE